jgi:hypothetical protein
MSQTTSLSLPLIAAGQAQKHVTHNDALQILDAVLQIAVESSAQNSVPAAPAEGQRWIVGPAPTGAFAGKSGQIAAWMDGSWRFFAPRRGWIAASGASALLHVHDGSGWRAPLGSELQNVERFGLGMAADAAKPLSVKASGGLFTSVPSVEGGSGDIRLYVNRSDSSNTGSLQFQTGFSTRAEFGLVGAEAFAIRTSPDGATFATGLRVNPADGIVTLPGRPAFRARRAGGDLTISTAGALLPFNESPLNVRNAFDVAASVFRAPASGVYAFSCAVFAADAGQRCIVDFIRNGITAVARAELAASAGVNDHIMGSVVEQMAQNDTMELRAMAGNIRITGGHFTHFSGMLVS